MKKTGIQNAEICRLIAAIGHTQYLVVADVGLPVPAGVQCVDLALRTGMPSFDEVLDCVLAEMVYESYVLAQELRDEFPEDCKALTDKLASAKGRYVSHEAFKELCKGAYAIIRTGESRAYRNIILGAGVNF